MALARTHSIAIAGVQGHVVEIEADIENGLVGLQLIGLPGTALREARDRIRSAVINSGHDWPMRRITVGLSPASLPKRGSGFDAAIAVAVLSADGMLPMDCVDGTVSCAAEPSCMVGLFIAVQRRNLPLISSRTARAVCA